MMSATQVAIDFVENGLVPDALVRRGIRRLLRERLRALGAGDADAAGEMGTSFADAMRASVVAPLPASANAQHYEVPAAFFAEVLGPRRKYSSAWWPDSVATLAAAEEAALATTCERAGLSSGQQILELGCGWGSLTLWMAERFPSSRITAVSNSNSQRAYIEAEVARRGLSNVRVITCDMNDFAGAGRFDRVVSVEMFEHMRNWPELFRRVSGWLNPAGRFFMHVFVHRTTPYEFVARDASDWMSQYFFSGGMMPSDELAIQFQDDLRFVRRWRWNGTHYERTANAWLANMDCRSGRIMPILQEVYGRDNASIWWSRWRIFFMSCAEMFGFDRGQQWWVSHYLFEKRA